MCCQCLHMWLPPCYRTLLNILSDIASNSTHACLQMVVNSGVVGNGIVDFLILWFSFSGGTSHQVIVFTSPYNTNDFEICSESHVIWNELEHCFEHLTQVMNKPISSLFVCCVVYCVVFRQTLKNIRRTHKQKHKETEQKQKSSKKNINNNRNTGYPALDPTANKYLSGSGWEISVLFVLCLLLCFVCVLWVVMCFICVYMWCFDCKCKSLKRLGENKKQHKET